MYRKILVEEGNILEFFKTIYFFTECLAIIGKVPAGFPHWPRVSGSNHSPPSRGRAPRPLGTRPAGSVMCRIAVALRTPNYPGRENYGCVSGL